MCVPSFLLFPTPCLLNKNLSLLIPLPRHPAPSSKDSSEFFSKILRLWGMQKREKGWKELGGGEREGERCLSADGEEM